MLNTVKGIYKNGHVILEETPETDEPMEVLVTFTKILRPVCPWKVINARLA
jgi:hypothetical protein